MLGNNLNETAKALRGNDLLGSLLFVVPFILLTFIGSGVIIIGLLFGKIL